MAATTRRMRITEIFHSLQGETSRAGLPTVFVRLTGCPLRCGYCDTAYAFTGGVSLDLEAVLARVARYECPQVTVTGGEPLAQAGTALLLERLCAAGYEVSLETSGAIATAGLDERVAVVLDLKTPGSGEAHRNDWSNVARLRPRDTVKFVLCDRADYDWARYKLQALSLAERCEVLFSPVAESLAPQRLADWILEDALPVRFQLQLHKVIWGDVPGR